MAQRLSPDERAWIETMHAAGISVEETARGSAGTGPLCIASSTAAAGTADTARRRAARAAAVRSKAAKLVADPGLAAAVTERQRLH